MPADVTYDVEAQLRVDAKNAVAGMRSVSSAIDRLRERLSGANSASGGLARQLLAVGGAYAALNAVSNTVRTTATGIEQYANNVEQASISIATLSNRIEGIPFEEGERRAHRFIEELERLAIDSPAGGQDLVKLFVGLSGPIARITGSMEDALVMSQQLANTASSLGVDFEQAGRDFRAMLEGRAGMDVLLFSRLRSVGDINQNAEAWNAMAQANPAEAYEKLKDILDGYNVAAARQGRSMAGLTEAFKSMYQRILGSAYDPIRERFKTFLADVNDRLLANMTKFRQGFRSVGETITSYLDKLFERLLSGLDYVANNWDRIVERMNATVHRVAYFASLIPALAKGFAVFQGARMGGAAALGIGGGLMGALGGTTAAGGVLHALVAAVTSISRSSAATGPLSALTDLFSSPLSIIGSIGKIVGFVVVFALLGTAMAVGASIARELTDNWSEWAAVWKREVAPLLDLLKAEFIRLWHELRYVMRDIGRGALRLLINMFKGLVISTIEVVKFLRDMHIMFVVVSDALSAFVNNLLEVARRLTYGAVDIAPVARRDPREIQALIMARITGTDPEAFLHPEAYLAAQRAAMAEDAAAAAAGTGGGGDSREGPTQNFDFRGSRITMQQEFASDDPDRVAAVIRQDLAGQANRRVMSGFVPALGR